MSYYVNLPAPQVPRNALLDLSPVNNALEGVRDQNNANRNALLQQSQLDMRKEEQTYQRGRDQKQDAWQEVQRAGAEASAIQQMPDTDPAKPYAWQNYVKKHGDGNHSPEELDFRTGPAIAAAAAGKYFDRRDSRMKDLEIQRTQAQINQLNQRAEDPVMSVNGNLVRVPRNGGPAQEIYKSGPDQTKAPQGYTFTPQGTLEPIPGGPGDKLTEGESKDALFAERMLRSEQDLQRVVPLDPTGKPTGYDPTQARNALVPDKGVMANLINSKEWQSYQRAARESLSAILRKDTGAAVTDEEFNTYFPTYFPIPGDSPQVVLEKQKARQAVAAGMRGASSRAFNRMFPDFDKRSNPSAAPAANDLKSKYGLE